MNNKDTHGIECIILKIEYWDKFYNFESEIETVGFIKVQVPMLKLFLYMYL